MQWWRRVDSISQRKNKPQPVLNGSFLRGLNEFFAKLCQDDSYTEPSFQEINMQYNCLKALDDRECRYVRLCAMDFAKAFDNVRHNIVLVTN